jgi:ribosome-associated protein
VVRYITKVLIPPCGVLLNYAVNNPILYYRIIISIFFNTITYIPFDMSKQLKYIKIEKLPIRFGQFLKLANLVQDGVEAKIRIQAGEVLVNGCIETQRGRKLKQGDTVTLNENIFKIERSE